MNFDAFVQDITANGWRVHGAEVYCLGRQVAAFGDACDAKYPIYSATEEEKRIVYETHNDSEYMKGILIRR